MSHELSTTIQIKDKWYNFASVINVKQRGDAEILRLYRSGKIKPISVRGDMPAAVDSAKSRSERYQKPRSALNHDH